MRKAFLIGSAVITVVIIIVIALFTQKIPIAPASSPSEELPSEAPLEAPPNIFVVPEVPLGTLTIILVCFFALLISQKKSKAKLQ